MSKGLEALKEIQKQVGNIHYYDFSDNLPRQTNIELRESGLFEIVEKELQDYENLKLKHQSMTDKVLPLLLAFQALEIIKKKNVRINDLLECSLEDYNNLVEIDEELTKKEYDLLKEVLL